VRQRRQQRRHPGRRGARPILDEFVTRAGQGKIGAARQVALEPLVQRLADEVRAGEYQAAEGREHGERDA